jgi:hypothetical protein
MSERLADAALEAMRLTASLSVKIDVGCCTAGARPRSQILPQMTSHIIAATEKAYASEAVMSGAAECCRRDCAKMQTRLKSATTH